ncbi:MAG: protein kinase [Candidatus Krumholzibacteria bacterium]|nr:protein kinase [Candidatus Krumholzibacteria bacterium]
MDFQPGTTIGPYVVSREIGRGGMGVVYLANDPRLDRQVAIKVLPEHLAADPSRLERFEKEARVLAQVHHPNVAGILGLEEKDGQRFLILEYVPGESLADRLERGPLGLDEAIEICSKIAAGMEAAHEAGIIHRDLKPDNVHLTPEGEVKVLDFGLARTDEGTSSTNMETISADTPTIAAPDHKSLTMPGVILGTAPYMSPEQARGRRVDKRTDIWSFGVVLYECLAGAGPFVGETVSDSIGAILHKDVDLDRLPATTPAMVRHVLRRCLARDKAHRYRDIGDVRLELTSPPDELATAQTDTTGGRRLTGAGLALAVVLAVVAGALAWALKPQPAPEARPVIHAEISLPEGQRLAHMFQPAMALTPDGRSLVFLAGARDETIYSGRYIRAANLMLRRLDEPEAVAIASFDEAVSQLAISPDGDWLAYATQNEVHKVSIDGTRTAKLNSRQLRGGMSWGEGDIIVGSGFERLFRFPAEGGEGDTLTTLDTAAEELAHTLPHFLPGGRTLLFTVMRFGYQLRAPAAWSVWALDLDTRERMLVLEHASDGRYVNGSLVFMREGALYSAPFDLASLATTGRARVVVDDVRHCLYGSNTAMDSGTGIYAVSTNGDLVYATGGMFQGVMLTPALVDLEGNPSTLDIKPDMYHNLRGSPDARTILLSSYYPTTSKVLLHDPGRGVTRPQVREGQGMLAIWGPGPDTITFDRTDEQGRKRIASKPLGGSAADETEIPVPDGMTPWISTWSTDGEVLLAWDAESRDILAYTEAAGWERLGGLGSGSKAYPKFSPDSRWLAYVSNESGQAEVLVKPFGRPGGSRQVSVGGGVSPLWSEDGRHIYYRYRGDELDDRWVMAVEVAEVDGQLEFSTPRKLFADEYITTRPIQQWSMFGPDRFLLAHNLTEEERQARFKSIHPDKFFYVQNWASRLTTGD